MASEKQLAANRANAQLSTGPTSPEGKVKIAHNALKTGLTGRTVVLPSEDVAAYQAEVERLFEQFAPETDEEKRLTQSLGRLNRIPALETGIYAIGRREFAAQFADETDETARQAMIESQVLLTYRRDLTNLSLQGMRLRRQYEKDEAELKRLATERKAAIKDREEAEKARWENAVKHYNTANRHRQRFDPAELGFEFSMDDFARYLDESSLKAALASGSYYEQKAKGWLKRSA